MRQTRRRTGPRRLQQRPGDVRGAASRSRGKLAVHLMRSDSNARNVILSQGFSFQRKCLITSARESL